MIKPFDPHQRTSIRSSVHQGTVQATRYMNILLYSLAPPDGRTNGTRQPRARPVPLPIHQRMAGRLVCITNGYLLDL